MKQNRERVKTERKGKETEAKFPCQESNLGCQATTRHFTALQRLVWSHKNHDI